MATSLGTLTLDLVAKVGGFTDGLTAAERQAQKSADEINKQIASIGVASYAVGNALGQYLKEGVDVAISAFPDLIDSVAKFQDIADKTGGSASGFAAFAVSAKTADVSIESIVDASARMSKALLQAGDDTKPITAGLNALGINIADFKKQSPDQQIKTVANSFGQFADGANKAAVAQQLFGRSGADLLKFFKDYTDNGGDVSILTDAMIKQADDFTDANKRASAQFEQYAGALAVQVLPALTGLKQSLLDAATEALGLGDKATGLGTNTSVRDFAQNAAVALRGFIEVMGTAVDGIGTFLRAAQLIGTSVRLGAEAAQLANPVQGIKNVITGTDPLAGVQDAYAQNIAAFNTYQKSFQSTVKNANLDQTKALRTLFDSQNKAADQASIFGGGAGGNVRPQLNATAPQKKGAADDAAQLAKAQLNADLDGIKAVGKAQQDAIANDQKVLEAMHSAGLTDDTDYYSQRKTLIDENTKAQVDSLNQQIARMQDQSFTGKSAAKDEVDNNKKIADAQAQVTKIQADAVTQSQVLDIQEQSRLRKQQAGLLASKQALQDYLDTANKGYSRNLASQGLGDKANDFNSQLDSINDNFDRQRQNLQNQRALTEKANGTPLTGKDKDAYDQQLKDINDFQTKSVASFKKGYSDIADAQSKWENGAIQSLQNYADAANNTASLTKGVFDDAFKGLEDSLTTFFTTGKADWKSYADSVIADITRMAIKQQITGPIAGLLGGSTGSNGQTSTGLLGSLLGSGGASGGISSFVGKLFGSSGGGGNIGAGLTGMGGGGFASGGYTGAGAANDPAGIVHAGEYVLNAATTRRLGVANLNSVAAGGGMGNTQVVNFNVQGDIDQSTQKQVALRTRQAQLTNAARFRA